MQLHYSKLGAICAASMIGFIALAAWADTPPPPPPPPPPPIGAVPGACKQDIQTFCPDVKPGDGRIATCIRTYYRALSPACKEAIRENRRERAEPPPPPPPPTSPPPASPPSASAPSSSASPPSAPPISH